ncbi:MAG: helix-turn-helix domain-containing protein [Chloroflexi bacterium]|nr:helix-turn-helix domain-containing protein [Chloroflexota bacterium]
MEHIADALAKYERIILEGFDPISAHGFTQVPNVVLRDTSLSPGAKLCYALLLSYAWQKDSCFPGQEALAKDAGTSRRSIVRFMKELEQSGYLEKKRRGLGKTNVYTLHSRVEKSTIKRKTERHRA